jgi:prolipoprotein diacylglyceryltransferase
MTYPVCRFLLEFIRGDERMRVGGLDIAQLVSLILLLIGLFLWRVIQRRYEKPTCNS